MRRGFRIGIVGIALLVGIFVCGSAFATTFINIATGSTGGTYYPVGAAMAKIWNTSIPGMKAGAQSTGGTAHNIQLMGNKEAEVGFLDGLYYYAYMGKGDKFEGKPQTYLRALVPLYPEPLQILVAKGSGIKTLQDLKGKRVSIGAVASGTESQAIILLKAAGLDPQKDIRPEHLGVGDTTQAFSNKQIDAALMCAAVGSSGIVEATTLGLVDFIDIPAPIVNKVVSQYPYFVPFTIPANSYRGQNRPVKCLATWNILGIRNDVDEKTAYLMTKALYEHKKDILNVNPKLATMSPENIKYIKIPLHPGAVKYYKEIGTLK